MKLSPMNELELEDYLNYIIKFYAEEKIKAKNWDESVALERSRQQILSTLGKGLETENQYLFVAEQSNKLVGYVWLQIDSSFNGFVNDISLLPEFRGKGLGKKLFVLMDEKLKEFNVTNVMLHVFYHNTAAINLYKELGYNVTNLYMSKKF